jgi:medium-chain acyl-[acyl-carrier-protein] hydrolase
MSDKVRSVWLPFTSGGSSALRLFCLPHSGAGASVYRGWGVGLPDEIAVCPVQPPGRETRRRESPFSEVGPLVSALADELVGALDGPYAIFGHSTGAVCAFELCRTLRRLGAPAPQHLFVAGRRAPHLPERVTGLEDMTIDQLVDVLRRHGGTPDWVFSAPGMIRMMRPLLIADFAVSERYVYCPEPALDVPITVFAATRDERASVAQMAAWQEQTTRDFRLHELVGGHFAVIEQAAETHRIIVETMRNEQLPAQ